MGTDAALPYRFDPALVVYRDAHFLAISKPSGLDSVPSGYSPVQNLSYGVREWWASMESAQGREAVNINRLDRPTSGLVLFALDQQTARGLHSLFRKGRVKKTYLVWIPASHKLPCCNRFDCHNTIDGHGILRPAHTRFTLLGTSPDGRYQCWAAWPRTGRTHQIRRHCAATIGPIAGDILYGGSSADWPGEGIGLHCYALRFRHPVGGAGVVIRNPAPLPFTTSTKENAHDHAPKNCPRQTVYR